MPINLHFDPSNKVETPTLILAYKSGRRIGQLTNIYGIHLADNMSEAPGLSFNIDKYNNGEVTPYWNDITTFKLIYCKEYNTWFEARVEYTDSTEVTKQVSLTRLGEAELQMVNVYGLEVNTDADIDREDYVITKLYSNNHDGSLLHRILSFAPHYSIAYVDPSVKDIQREFSFNEQSVYECLQNVAEEENLYINYNSSLSSSNKIQRSISVYDLFSNCHSCGHRGNFTKVCPVCGSTNITEGYGHNTTICVSREDLGEDITVSDNVDQIRNCYHVSGGDDYITDTVRNCNLSGGKPYLWRFTDEMKNDMSDELRNQLNAYESLYSQYMNNQAIDLSHYVTLEDGSVKSLNISAYNAIIQKYQAISRAMYDTEIAQLQTIYNTAVATRQASHPSQQYIGNVDINHRPVIYNEDESYSVGNSAYVYFPDGDNYVFYYYTGIRENGDVLSDIQVIQYLESFRTGNPTSDMSGDNSRYKILYKVEVITKSDFDDACIEGNEYISDIESTYRDIYDKEGKALCKLEQAKNSKAGVGDPTSTSSSLLEIGNIVGFPALITAWYNTYDVYYYLHDNLMPMPSMYQLTAQVVVDGLTASNISPVAVAELDSLTLEIAQNAVLGCAKIVADSSFKVELAESALNMNTHVWSGKFKVTSLYDEKDVATSSSTVSITITENYADYITNRLEKKLYNSSKNNKGIIDMLGMNESQFKLALRAYSLTELSNIKSCFEGCVAVLSGLGAEESSHAAHSTYIDMVNKVEWTEAEINVRESECNTVNAICGTSTQKNSTANPFGLLNIKVDIQQYLDLEKFLGAILWNELNAFRREEAYSDSNYISDGLDNGELIRRSYELLQSAEQKMAENNLYSYEITATLKNLLLIPEFEPLKEYLACGNWLRIKTDDGKLFKLRLTSYEFDFDNPNTLNVTFSDITDTSNIRSMQSLVKKMDYITRNASQVNLTSKFEYINESISEVNSSAARQVNDVSGVVDDVSNYVSTMNGELKLTVKKNTLLNDLDDQMTGIDITSNSITISSTGHFYVYSDNITIDPLEGLSIDNGSITGGQISGAIIDSNGSNGFCEMNEGLILVKPNTASSHYIRISAVEAASLGGDIGMKMTDGTGTTIVDPYSFRTASSYLSGNTLSLPQSGFVAFGSRWLGVDSSGVVQIDGDPLKASDLYFGKTLSAHGTSGDYTLKLQSITIDGHRYVMYADENP